MRRLMVFMAAAITMLPATAVTATELDDILERSHSAEYSAEQVISCLTPEGVHSAFVSLAQADGELRVSARVSSGIEVTAGSGGWTLTRSDELVTGASVEGSKEKVDPLYTVEDAPPLFFLGRRAQAFRLHRDGVLRAELVVDDETGALVQALTFDADGEVYCERRFVSLDATTPDLADKRLPDVDPTQQTWVDDSQLPLEVEGFERLDHYEDEDGFSFAYYSDGFFSFALFETPALVDLPGATEVQLDSGVYHRVFSAGQVSYSWEASDGAMALIGDLPPDLHEPVLGEMPPPENRGFLRRWWRALFG